MSAPKLIFEMRARQSKSLIVGEIRLVEADHGNATTRWPATSGIPSYQTPKHYWTRGKGLLPPSREVAKQYVVNTELLHSDNFKAVGENLFAIVPFNVWSKDGEHKRTNVALHLDANHTTSPGSAGCIVFLNEYSWKDFCKKIGQWHFAGCREIPLEVSYS